MKRESPARTVALAATLALVLAARISAAQSDTPTRWFPNAAETQAIAGRFAVVQVDEAKRTMVLWQSQIGIRNVKAGPRVALAGVKADEQVEALYYPEVALELRSAFEPAPKLWTRRGRVLEPSVTERVVAVDDLAHTVTVQGSMARTHIICVTDPTMQAQLGRLRSGERMQLTYAPAVVVSLHRVK